MIASIVNGIPVSPDVEALMRAFDGLKPGDRVEYDKFPPIIGQDARSARGKTVIAAWRRRLERECNLILRCIPGVGYEVCDPMARVSVASSRFRGGLRDVSRAARIAARTDRLGLTPDAAKSADHITHVAATIDQVARVAPRAINFQSAIKQVTG